MSGRRDFIQRLAHAAITEGLIDAAYGTIETTLGPLLVVQSPTGVCRIAFPEEPEDRVLEDVAAVIGPRLVPSADWVGDSARALASYLEGASPDLSIPVDMRLVRSSFRLSVLAETARVRRGRFATYSEIARRVGHPRAARAAGTALAQNPVPIVVPCHRILPSGGKGIGNYGGGAARKEMLLRLEGALEGDGEVAAGSS